MKKLFPGSAMLNIGTILFFFCITSCKKPGNDPSPGYPHGGSPGSAMNEPGKVATDWYKLQLQIIVNASPAMTPVATARIFGYEGVTLFETVRNGIPNSVSLSSKLYQMPVMPPKENNNGYSWTVAANAALAQFVRTMYPALTDANKFSVDSLEKLYNESLTPVIGSAVFTRSQSFGKSIATAVTDWAKTDNNNHANDPYTVPVFPGAWEPTLPALAPPAAPFQGNDRPLLQIHASGTGPAFPFAYSEEPSSDFYKMVKDIYDLSQSLTAEQKSIALFWNDVGIGKGYTPPGHSVSILNQLLDKEKSSLGKSAMAYAKAGIALRDANIMCWRAKYFTNMLRPVTYIRKFIDPAWLPLLGTPNHPEYPAAHAYVTSSAMQALTGIFGDNYSFTDHTYDFLGMTPRNFSSLNAAAAESGNSRRYGGIHYQLSINTGLASGRTVGKDVSDIKLQQ